MSLWFLAIAALMLAAALACVAVPLLRAGRRSGRARAPFVLALILVFALPPAALGLYAWFGMPAALRLSHANNPVDLAQATAQLRAKLERSPEHPEGWALLAQAYTSLGRPVDARAALGRALRLKPDDPDLMAAWAESDAEANPNHRIEGRAYTLLQRAVKLSPDHQRALWLLGISDYQLGRFGDAAVRWKHLLTLLPPGSRLAQGVDTQIAMAQARAGGETQAQAETIARASVAQRITNAADGSASASRAVALKIQVRLDPKLAREVSPKDTLFVFAHAINGPPMPLAVARLDATTATKTVTLTDAMAMAPQLKLSSFPRVQVSARISKSGDALPHPGDLESQPVQVATDARQPVTLTIDRVH